MGLDGIELVMAVEEEFKISILDSEVGGLVDVIYSKLRHSMEEPCPSQHGFYIVRRQMMNLLGLKRSLVKPQTKLADVIPIANRGKIWLELLRSLTGEETFWPSLVRPRRMNRIVVAWIPGVVCLCIIMYLFSFSVELSILAGLFTGFVALIVGDRLTASFKQEFPDNCSHVQELTRFVKTLDSRIWTREEVFDKVKAITVEVLGVKESQVTPEANFVDDLGVG